MRSAAPAALALLVLAGAAAAQQQPVEFQLKLSGPELVLVAKGLAKMPYEDVANLLQKVQAQADEQMRAMLPKEPRESK